MYVVQIASPDGHASCWIWSSSQPERPPGRLLPLRELAPTEVSPLSEVWQRGEAALQQTVKQTNAGNREEDARKGKEEKAEARVSGNESDKERKERK